jgi:hypothetical protein
VADCYASAAGQTLRNLDPAIAEALMEIENQRILFCSPRLAAQVRVEAVDPVCTALLANAPWDL